MFDIFIFFYLFIFVGEKWHIWDAVLFKIELLSFWFWTHELLTIFKIWPLRAAPLSAEVWGPLMQKIVQYVLIFPDDIHYNISTTGLTQAQSLQLLHKKCPHFSHRVQHCPLLPKFTSMTRCFEFDERALLAAFSNLYSLYARFSELIAVSWWKLQLQSSVADFLTGRKILGKLDSVNILSQALRFEFFSRYPCRIISQTPGISFQFVISLWKFNISKRR